jgi:hypothetical protein
VEAKQSVIENMAPVLTRLFTLLFAAVLVAFLGALLWTGRGVEFDRDTLIQFNLILVVVLGLLLYSVSARDHRSPPGVFDVLQVVLVVGALLADAVALWAIAARITEFGFSPNRVGGAGCERDTSGQPGVVRRALHPLPEEARIVHGPRTVADGLPAGLCRVVSDCRDRLPTGLRVRLRSRCTRSPQRRRCSWGPTTVWLPQRERGTTDQANLRRVSLAGVVAVRQRELMRI